MSRIGSDDLFLSLWINSCCLRVLDTCRPSVKSQPHAPSPPFFVLNLGERRILRTAAEMTRKEAEAKLSGMYERHRIGALVVERK